MRQELHRQARIERVGRGVVYVASIAEYVVGILLATSFIQQILPAHLTALVGLLVLTAALVRRQFHPEETTCQASRSRTRIIAALRDGEDHLAELNCAVAQAREYLALARKISQDLTLIQAAAIEPISRWRIVNAEQAP